VNVIPVATTGGPSWTDILTAIGTVAVAAVAVWVALWTDRRAARQLKAEHDRSDQLLKEERERSDRQLAEEREHSRAQIEEERQIAREREQLAEAYQVQVFPGERPGAGQDIHDPAVVALVVLLVNHGSFTIREVEAQFSVDGTSLVSSRTREWMSGFPQLHSALHKPGDRSKETARHGILTPWDGGMRFESDEMPARILNAPYPLLRWTDRWGTRWEHRRGEVRQVHDDEPWEP